MELGQKIKKYRNEARLSQENLAEKIFVSRTLISKYESGRVFPTQENLKKIATALDVSVEDLLSSEEKDEIVEKSYKTMYRFWMILSICFIIISVILLLMSVIPFYHYSSYDYSSTSPNNPTPIHITGYTSIIAVTLKEANPISVINIVFLLSSIILFLLTFTNLNIKPLRIIRFCSIIVFIISIVLFFFSLSAMLSSVSALDFRMNTTSYF